MGNTRQSISVCVCRRTGNLPGRGVHREVRETGRTDAELKKSVVTDSTEITVCSL